eukprot:g10608.t1
MTESCDVESVEGVVAAARAEEVAVMLVVVVVVVGGGGGMPLNRRVGGGGGGGMALLTVRLVVLLFLEDDRLQMHIVLLAGGAVGWHGQGCGEGCGCVMDIQVAVDREGVVADASFTAKRLVMAVDGSPMRSRAGKLLLHDCPCDTLRSLGSIATSECHGESLESLRNRLLFSPNAPPSFLRNLVRRLGTPRHSAACAQVVEAALTTALTDRPYSRPPSAYAGPLIGAGQELPGVAAGGGWRAGIPVPDTLATVTAVEGEEEDDGLAEVDFRDQYDDFA